MCSEVHTCWCTDVTRSYKITHTHFSESVRLIGATCSLISSCHGNHFPETALWRHSGGRMYGGCGGWSRWLRSACTQMKYYTVLALSDLTSAVVLNSFRFYFFCFIVRFTSIICCFSTSQFIDTDWILLCDFQRTIVLNEFGKLQCLQSAQPAFVKVLMTKRQFRQAACDRGFLFTQSTIRKMLLANKTFKQCFRAK